MFVAATLAEFPACHLRPFTYDSLGRLLSADNPEDVVVGGNSGRIDYVYDDDSKLTSTTDARGITTIYYYDSLDRLIKRTFSDSTPTEHNCYDGKVFDHSTNACVTPGTAIPFSVGRMTSAGVEGVGSMTTTEFDPLGRALSTSQKTWTGSAYNTYTFAYSYNFNDSITSMTYPSGREIEYAYDAAGRPYSVGEDGGSSYVNSVNYTVHGRVKRKQLGNLLHEQYCYNARLQRTGQRLGDEVLTTGCAWDADDKLQLTFGFGADTANNGNLAQQTIKASAGYSWTQYYAYDDVNRLSMASENAAITGSSCPSGATWCQKYGYDHFGNQWVSASLDTLHMATPTSSSAVDPDTNRLTSGTYDAAGNLTAQAYITPGGSMTYDANNKMTSFTATGVSVATGYAGGARMRKVFNSETTIWVYDAMGRLAAEYRNGTGPGLSASTPDKEFVYLGSELVAMVEDSEIYYRTTDHLGSSRVITDSGGAVVRRQDFFPFGEQIPASASFGNRNDVSDGGIATYNASLSMRQQFTGQQRDAETGLDYFWARNMAAPLGRFLSMDPENAGAGPGNPQSWNAYAYVYNNPLTLVDPDGRTPCIVTSNVTHYYADGTVKSWDGYSCYEVPINSPSVYHTRNAPADPNDGLDTNEEKHAGFYAIQFMPSPPPVPKLSTKIVTGMGLPEEVKSLLRPYFELRGLTFFNLDKIVLMDGTGIVPDGKAAMTWTPPWIPTPLLGGVGSPTYVFINPGEYDPNTKEGIALLAHEAWHGVQQTLLGGAFYGLYFADGALGWIMNGAGLPLNSGYNSIVLEQSADSFAAGVEGDLTAIGWSGF